MTDYEDQTVEELRDELRDRDLKVSGTKDELIARLEDAEDDDGGSDDGAAPDAAPSLAEVVRRIRDDLHAVTGLDVEGVSGVRRGDDDGYTAVVDVVELSRVPRTMDVLASYEVSTQSDGAVTGYQRLRRYRRAEAGTQ